MLYFNTQFDNYEDFRQRFGYRTREDGGLLLNKNGKPQRLHSVIFQYWKTYIVFAKKNNKNYPFEEIIFDAPKLNTPLDVYYHMLRVLRYNQLTIGPLELQCILSRHYQIVSEEYSSDLITCLDVRNDKRVPIKLGKYLQLVFNDFKTYKTDVFWLDNPILVTFFIETMCQQWNTNILTIKSLHLVVDKDFQGIYSTNRRWPSAADFRSCMDDDPNWQFYANHPDLFSAVSLQGQDGTIFARCILINCKENRTDKEHKLLERVYFNKQIYANQLLQLAKKQGIYDLIKNPGASCRDCLSISTIGGSAFRQSLYIPLQLSYNDVVSYQDTFKYYYPGAEKASNDLHLEPTYYSLATTSVHYRP